MNRRQRLSLRERDCSVRETQAAVERSAGERWDRIWRERSGISVSSVVSRILAIFVWGWVRGDALVGRHGLRFLAWVLSWLGCCTVWLSFHVASASVYMVKGEVGLQDGRWFCLFFFSSTYVWNGPGPFSSTHPILSFQVASRDTFCSSGPWRFDLIHLDSSIAGHSFIQSSNLVSPGGICSVG